ncbi:MAG: FtsX-like permease family protein [Microthrixaceae bacterium]|nr:FtsX-like permease family protein [Microthrixaceae bacterium]
MFRVALKDILARKRRLVTTGLAILLGIAFLTGTQMLSQTLKGSISAVFDDAYAGYDAVVRSPKEQDLGFGQRVHVPLPASTVDEVRSVAGVAAASGIVESANAKLIGADGKVASSSFGPPTIIYNWQEERLLRTGKVTEGREPKADNEMVLDFGSAAKAGYRVGDKVKITANSGTQTFKLVGLVGLGTDGKTPTGATTLIFPTAVAQELADLTGKFNYIAVAGDEGLSQEALASAIAGARPELQVLTGAEFAKENADSVGQVIDILATFVTVFGYIALFVAAFIIYNTFSILVAQRTRETALLRAVGAHRRQIVLANLIEAAFVGFVASILGLLVGTGLASVLRRGVSAIFSMSTSQTLPGVNNITTALGVGVGVTVISSFVPSYKASRVPPIAALSEATLDRGIVSFKRIVVGSGVLLVGAALAVAGFAELGPNPLLIFGAGAALVLIAVSLVLAPIIVGPAIRFLGLFSPWRRSVVSRLSRANAIRNPRRTASTAAALTIGVTLVTLIAIIASSIKASVSDAATEAIKADFIVSVDTFSLGSGIPPETVKEIQALDSVAVASPMRFGPVRITDAYARKHAASSSSDDTGQLGVGATSDAPPGEDTLISGIDPKTAFESVNFGKISGNPADFVDGTLAVSKVFAEERGWKLGDEIPLYFAQTGEQKLRVAFFYTNFIGSASFHIPIETFNKNMLKMFDVDYLLTVQAKDGVPLAQVRKELDSAVKDLPTVTVQDLGEYVKSQTAPFDTFLAIVYALLMLAVIIALIGIANTLSLSILERTRELGLLRAVGMSKRQLRRSVFAESVLISVFGTAIGLVLGLVFSAAISTVIAADNPDIFQYTVPVPTLVVVVIGAMFAGVLAAVVPAWRTAKMQVLEAVSAL